MAKRRTTYGKLERDRAKKAKAAAKRERRQDRTEPSDDEALEDAAPVSSAPTLPEDEVLDRLARIHEQFDAGELSFDDFEEAKANLLEHLDVS